MFTKDRDLLALEPALFRDVAWIAQRLVRGTGTIAGTTLTLATADTTLEAAGVTTGHVLSYDNVALEVVERLSATTATVSRPRPDPDDPPIPPAPSAANLLAEITTFAPQIAIIHDQLLRMLGIDPADPGAEITETNITNPRSLILPEALGALHLIYTAAAAPQRRDGPLAERADMYRRRYAQERQRTVVRLDLDNDAIADATRRFSVAQLLR
ncbi:MAG: hypothetical protein R3B68_06225 [Phycisphaerales bacterium]